MENDVYFQIGLVTLIGLSAKNAILIVEFAILERAKGLSIVESAVEGAEHAPAADRDDLPRLHRGRDPARDRRAAPARASRHSIGTGVIGGMIGATTLALFFVPLFYVLIGQLSERFFPPKPATPPRRPRPLRWATPARRTREGTEPCAG